MNKTRIAIWGTGVSANQLIKYLKVNNYQLIQLIDNNQLKWGDEISEVKIVSPQEIEAELVVICSFAESAIIEQIESMKDRTFDYLTKEQFLNKITPDFDAIDFRICDHTIMNDAYNQDNYEIHYTSSNSDKCLVVFSSNGLVLPQTINKFYQTIQIEDKYECKGFLDQASLVNKYSKIIYVRDIYQQWYIKGINSKYNSIEKLMLFLEKEVSGYKVTTFGSSAGGYVATLFGRFINSEMIINISGQFDINKFDSVHGSPIRDLYSTDYNREKYYDIIPHLRASIAPIFYFFPMNSIVDRVQYERVSESHQTNFFEFMFDHDQHDLPVSIAALTKILTLNVPELKELYRNFINQCVNPRDFEVFLGQS